MKESEGISKLFEDLYNGKPWIDVSLAGTLGNISAKQAAKKISSESNSIWEIVNHLISWRQHILQRIQGSKINVAGDNYFAVINDTSESAWQDTLKRLEDSQKQWISFLKNFKETDFEIVNPNNNMTNYEHIHGIIQHDAYHLGQIVMLSKSV
ncbi:MAG TPA: DinB family protein [Ignavibacteria bacterium]|jgi:uncharacterized damage-inducible protein DinB